MPATEQTWRDLKVLHVVFGVSALALLVATVAMLVADHNRPWKKYQREFREIETWTASARLAEEESRSFTQRSKELEASLAEQRRADLDPGITAAFLSLAASVPEDAEAADIASGDLEQLASTTDPDQRFVLRGDLLQRLQDIVDRCSYREDQAAGRLKLLKAQFDKARADFELAVADEAEQRTLDELQALADAATARVDEATLASQAASTHRKSLEQLLRQITAAEDGAAKALADHRASLEMLAKTRDDKAANIGKTILELPVLDAFNSPLRIDQIWLPDLTFNNNFREVARFDRCTTCHQGIEKSAPGNPTAAGYPETELLTITLQTPEDPSEVLTQAFSGDLDAGAPAPETAATLVVEGDGNDQLEKLYGLQFAAEGLFNAEDPTLTVIRPESLAAVAGLMPGDVIESIDGGRTYARDVAVAGLIESPSWGSPLTLGVRRGVPQPYASHPRLDLFVGSLSPHPKQVFGCTICHEGQGSATSFKWASHSPNSPKEAHDWHDEYGWFDNHHWIYPMHAERFEESSCLKCHHQVIDLEPSSRYPEPPAPKLVKGYHTIREYGCYGCHEINGYAGPETRIGPDMRLAPGFHEVAEALLGDPGLAALAPTAVELAEQVRSSPDTTAARMRLATLIKEDAAAGEDGVLTPRSHTLAALLKDPDTPGALPKVGPSLRHLSSKVSFDWLYSWLRNPMDFRPSTKMPRFFGLWDHLSGPGLAESERYEPIEIRSIISYLNSVSAAFEYVEPFDGITAEPDLDRGKKVVQVRGCLACHQHEEFPGATNNQGPDLSRIGAKLASHPNGQAWLYSWLREPARYHPKTLMPNVLLEPVTLEDGTVSDPAADAAAWLMQSTQDWQPTDIPAADSLTADERAATEELAAMYLEGRFTKEKASAYASNGLPESMADIGGDELMLVGLSADPAARDQQLLEYVGKKTIGKLACYSCHNIPGFEDAKPAGAALADWGRKESSKIAFEQIVPYLMQELGGHGHHGHANTDEHHEHGDHHDEMAGDADHDHGEESHGDADALQDEPVAAELAYADTREHHVSPESVDPDTGYFLEKMLAHDRQGFLWQKLRAPRSYDYQKTENKSYNERYRMPQFPFDEGQREAVMTFVLGLVAEPPAEEFLHRPAPREQARLDGLAVLEQFNCGGCHVLEGERWDIRYDPDSISDPPEVPDYAFLAPQISQAQLADALATDSRGRRFASLHGLSVLDAETGEPQLVDQDFIPIEREEAEEDPEIIPHRAFMLYEDAIINGQPWAVGSQNIFVPEDALLAGKAYPPHGGDLARLLFPVVIEDEMEINPNVKPDDAWGWLPPPLIGEGKKVQSGWLHTFLLAPEPIRPAAVLRMPKFNLSTQQASALVNYFAAVDGADFPYDYDPRYESSTLTEREKEYPEHLTDAMRIVTNGNYCVKCHLVGDYSPPGNPKALAPQLSEVRQRLRPDYVHGWIANPKRFLPYTGMPVNIPFDKPVSQDLYHGTSEEQVSALTDLLMHYDTFAGRSLSLDAFLQPPDAEGDEAAAVPQASAEPSQNGPGLTDSAVITSPNAQQQQAP